MSVEELKKQVTIILEKTTDEKVLEQVLSVLQNNKPRMTAQEIFDRVSARYDNTLRKLAQ